MNGHSECGKSCFRIFHLVSTNTSLLFKVHNGLIEQHFHFFRYTSFTSNDASMEAAASLGLPKHATEEELLNEVSE
jgi:hypothetical protein